MLEGITTLLTCGFLKLQSLQSFLVGHEYSSPFTEVLKRVLLDKELHNLYSPAGGLAYLFITFVGCLSTPRVLEMAFPSIRSAKFLSSSISATLPRLLISEIDCNLWHSYISPLTEAPKESEWDNNWIMFQNIHLRKLLQLHNGWQKMSFLHINTVWLH